MPMLSFKDGTLQGPVLLLQAFHLQSVLQV